MRRRSAAASTPCKPVPEESEDSDSTDSACRSWHLASVQSKDDYHSSPGQMKKTLQDTSSDESADGLQTKKSSYKMSSPGRIGKEPQKKGRSSPKAPSGVVRDLRTLRNIEGQIVEWEMWRANKWRSMAVHQWRIAWERNYWAFMGSWLKGLAQRSGRVKPPNPDYINFRGQRDFPLPPKPSLTAGQQKKSKPKMNEDEFVAAYGIGPHRAKDCGRPQTKPRKSR